MKRVNNLFEILISDANLRRAIYSVNDGHRWHQTHKPNSKTLWVESTIEDRIIDLRRLLVAGFHPSQPKVFTRWDKSAMKYRKIYEPAQWPDQYVHHALIQVLQPVMMRGMDNLCCGSIPDRGFHYAAKHIEKWVRKDKIGTKYCFSCDIYHFYDSLQPEIVMKRLRHLVKDWRVLGLVSRLIRDGVHIGYYPSQWFANTVLQPLDNMIRQSRLCKHYVRYMDNFTIFGSNKRNLRKLKTMICDWLAVHGLRLKGDWQIYPLEKNGKTNRLPDAVGYRFGRTYTIPRKKNLLKLKRSLSKYYKRKKKHKPISYSLAASILARFGILKHCSNSSLYKRLLKHGGIIKELKNVIRADSKNSFISWDEYLKLQT